MGEIIVAVLKWTFRATFVMAVVITVGALLSIVLSYMIIGFNMSVLADIFAIIQIWLPFNLNIVLLWLATASTAYLAFRIGMVSFVLFNTFIGKN